MKREGISRKEQRKALEGIKLAGELSKVIHHFFRDCRRRSG